MQLYLFDPPQPRQQRKPVDTTSTYQQNTRLPVHRWFRFSAGFSAKWVESLIREAGSPPVLDPFVGSGTTLIAAEDAGAQALGVEAHPFINRIASAKLLRRSNVSEYLAFARRVRQDAEQRSGEIREYPPLVQKCYHHETLVLLDAFRRAVEDARDDSPAWRLVWLTLVCILRSTSHVGTAQWQYVLPRKEKKRAADPFAAFDAMVVMVAADMRAWARPEGPAARIIPGDARDLTDVPDGFARLVITSPPYPNNYDYADATRLEMSFLGEIDGWGDLQHAVRRHLVRACSQHVPEKSVDLSAVLASQELEPIRADITNVCEALAVARETKGGRKTYHLMVACYFLDLARAWIALRRKCAPDARVCFVVGDSAPYGVYVPVIDWLGKLAVAAGFRRYEFERTRDRNVKWKNRKHRVPLCEGRLWVEG